MYEKIHKTIFDRILRNKTQRKLPLLFVNINFFFLIGESNKTPKHSFTGQLIRVRVRCANNQQEHTTVTRHKLPRNVFDEKLNKRACASSSRTLADVDVVPLPAV